MAATPHPDPSPLHTPHGPAPARGVVQLDAACERSLEQLRYRALWHVASALRALAGRLGSVDGDNPRSAASITRVRLRFSPSAALMAVAKHCHMAR